MVQQDERWYALRWQRVSENNEQVSQKAAVKLEQQADESCWSAVELEHALLQSRQRTLGWRDQ